ncbi:hypothetical protein [Rhodovulum sp. YEN HP10]|uniref:hypothetical protein n=1 Tax=Rhodovulum sp. HP10 TaxID=3387397 RepID=UPI0039DF5A7F
MSADRPFRSFRIQHGLRPEHRDCAAQGYWHAVSRKLRYPLGPKTRLVAFIEPVPDPPHAISAVSAEGGFPGVAGHSSPEGAFVSGGFQDLAAVYGRATAVF